MVDKVSLKGSIGFELMLKNLGCKNIFGKNLWRNVIYARRYGA